MSVLTYQDKTSPNTWISSTQIQVLAQYVNSRIGAYHPVADWVRTLEQTIVREGVRD
jgi:2-hydroxychromene-2-carboxylate isomerase